MAIAEIKPQRQVIFLADEGIYQRLAAIADYTGKSRSWVCRRLISGAYDALADRESAGVVKMADLLQVEQVESYLEEGA